MIRLSQNGDQEFSSQYKCNFNYYSEVKILGEFIHILVLILLSSISYSLIKWKHKEYTSQINRVVVGMPVSRISKLLAT